MCLQGCRAIHGIMQAYASAEATCTAEHDLDIHEAGCMGHWCSIKRGTLHGSNQFCWSSH